MDDDAGGLEVGDKVVGGGGEVMGGVAVARLVQVKAVCVAALEKQRLDKIRLIDTPPNWFCFV